MHNYLITAPALRSGIRFLHSTDDASASRRAEHSPTLTLAPLLAPPNRVDRARSRELGRLVRARNRECYTNAARALGAERESTYVEGYAVSHDQLLVFEHGWVERLDGTIIDPTPAYCGAGWKTYTYFPVFRWTWDEIWALYRASADFTLTFPLHDALPSRGRRRPEWRDATLAAHRHCNALSLAAWGTMQYEATVGKTSEQNRLRELLGAYWVDGADAVPPLRAGCGRGC